MFDFSAHLTCNPSNFCYFNLRVNYTDFLDVVKSRRMWLRVGNPYSESTQESFDFEVCLEG